MSETPFFKTRMGQQFFCKTVPDLIRAIERLNDVVERLVKRLEESDRT